MELFFAHGGLDGFSAGGSAGNLAAAGTPPADAGDEEFVRAPIKPKREQLVTAGTGFGSAAAAFLFLFYFFIYLFLLSYHDRAPSAVCSGSAPRRL